MMYQSIPPVQVKFRLVKLSATLPPAEQTRTTLLDFEDQRWREKPDQSSLVPSVPV